MRWEELRWDELKWSASEKCGVWSVKNAMLNVRKLFAWRCIAPGLRAGHVLGHNNNSSWSGSWSVKCGLWSVKCEVWNAKSAVWSVDCVVWSVECEVWSVECEACSEKCEVRSGKQVHARAWLEHGACTFYRWERSYIYIYIPKATSAPPRAGTTGKYWW